MQMFFPLNNLNNSIIGNGQESATIKLTSNKETYGLFLIGLSVDVWKPDLAPLVLTSSPLGGSSVNVDGVVDFSVNIKNNGNDDVKNLKIKTTIPQEVDLIEPITGLPSGVTYLYDSITRVLTFNVIDGITDVGDTSYSIGFKVEVKNQCYFLEGSCSDEFQLQLAATYIGVQNNNIQTTVSSNSTDACGIGNEQASIFSINKPNTLSWLTATDALNRIVSCENETALEAAQQLAPEMDCNLAIVKTSGVFVPSAECTTNGTYTNTWQFTDGCGRVSDIFTQIITIKDEVVPEITCPIVSENYNVDEGKCTFNGSFEATATDNCDLLKIVYSINGDDINFPYDFPVGRTTVNVIAIDKCGNTSEACMFDIVVTDNIAPTISCSSDVEVDVNPNECFATLDLVAPTTGDNCGVASVTNNAPATYPVGETIVTWTVTDTNGLTATCDQKVTVTDNINPTISCSSDVEVDVNPNECFATLDLVAPTTGDNCGVASVTNNAPATYPVGETIITWTVIDTNGLTATCDQKVTVTDNIAPTISCSSDVEVDVNPNECFATLDLVAPTTGDNCGVASVTNNAPATYPVGETIITWTVTDTNGLTATCDQKVTVTDNINPTISCSIDVEVDVNPNECFATLDLVAPTTGDNCGVASVTNNAPATYPVGETIVTWTVTDTNGLTATCDQKVTVTDNIAPTISCSSDVEVDVNPNECFATLDLVAPTTGDNCGVATSVTNNAPATYPVGETIVTWTVTDTNGLTATCDQKVTVTDNIAPTISCPTVATSYNVDGGECDFTATFEAIATDNCTTIAGYIYSIEGSSISFPYNFPVGTTTVSVVVTDSSGNESLPCEFDVVVIDNINPILDLSGEYDIELDCGDPNVDTAVALQEWLDLNAGVTATDNCENIEWENNYGEDTSVKCEGDGIVVTFIATDTAGNTASFTAEYLIKDETSPAITVQPIEKTVECNGLGNIDELNVWLDNNGGATAADDCSAVTWSNNFESINYTCSFIGEVEVIFTAKDGCGNTTDTAARKFIIKDTEVPVFEGYLPEQEITVSCDDVPTMEVLTATDNCDQNIEVVPNEVITGQEDECATEYTITRSWEVSDCAGNTTSHTQVITVEDKEAPVFVGELPEAELTVSCAEVPTRAVLVATDNCSIPTD